MFRFEACAKDRTTPRSTRPCGTFSTASTVEGRKSYSAVIRFRRQNRKSRKWLRFDVFYRVCCRFLFHTNFITFQEREIEPMDVSEPTPPVKTTAPASVTQQHQHQKEHSAEATTVDPSPSTQSTTAKPQKSVSFEDNEGYHENDDDHNESSRSVQLKRKQLKQQSKESKKSESDSADGLVTYLRRKQLKHQQHVAASQGAGGDGNTESLEIVNRKDRRHRSGMKSNGFFGPEGMWQNKCVGPRY